MPAGLRHLILVAALFALLLPANAKASGGSYTFSGGSEAARAEVRNALDASGFDWSLVPQTISIQIVDCGCAGSRPGVIVLDETLLESTPYGRAYTRGIVQHEYAHQVWWFTLDDEQRGVLQDRLGGADLCYERPGLSHDDHACERFASTLAWAYWPVVGNPMQSEKVLWARQFRRTLGRLLGVDRELAFPAHLERQVSPSTWR
jgi:hypothetical protein